MRCAACVFVDSISLAINREVMLTSLFIRYQKPPPSVVEAFCHAWW